VLAGALSEAAEASGVDGQAATAVTVVVDGDAVGARLGGREYQSFVPCIQDDVMDGWTGR
jgi:hypothetical protein